MNEILRDEFVLDAEKFFWANVFDESRVIKLNFDVLKHRFELVLNHTYSPAYIERIRSQKKSQTPMPDEFICLVFEKISDFKAKDRFIKNKQGEIEYSLQNSGALEIENISIKKADSFFIKIVFAWDTECQFTFQELRVKRRLGVGRKQENGEDYNYFDMKTGERFDFFHPFE